jgi:hypothetical protein
MSDLELTINIFCLYVLCKSIIIAFMVSHIIYFEDCPIIMNLLLAFYLVVLLSGFFDPYVNYLVDDALDRLYYANYGQ